jgi:AAA domain
VMTTLRALHDNPGEYTTLVIDTVDMLEAHLIEYVCDKNKWANIEQPSYGKGYVVADEEWRRFVRALTAIRDKHGMTIVLVAHSAIERIDDPRAPTYTSYQPKLHKRARALVMDATDAVFFLAEDLRVLTEDGGFRERTRAAAGAGRFVFTEGRPAFAAKNRFGMPEKIPIPADLNISELTRYWSH